MSAIIFFGKKLSLVKTNVFLQTSVPINFKINFKKPKKNFALPFLVFFASS